MNYKNPVTKVHAENLASGNIIKNRHPLNINVLNRSSLAVIRTQERILQQMQTSRCLPSQNTAWKVFFSVIYLT